MLRIRPLNPTDMRNVLEIITGSLDLNYSIDTYLEVFSFWPDGAIVGLMDGKTVAFAGSIISGPMEARIIIFAVDKAYRNRGIGSEMLRHLVSTCILNGIKVIKLEVRKSNGKGIRFYEKFGFAITEELPDCYKNGENGYRMVRWL